jgi:hypothetical protein
MIKKQWEGRKSKRRNMGNSTYMILGIISKCDFFCSVFYQNAW